MVLHATRLSPAPLVQVTLELLDRVRGVGADPPRMLGELTRTGLSGPDPPLRCLRACRRPADVAEKVVAILEDKYPVSRHRN